jgi:hypothetical protein
MDWMQFISALVSALAWPGAIVWIIFMLKRPILAAIPKIRSFKYGDLHIDLSEELKSLQEDLPVASPALPGATENQDAKPSLPVQLAALSPTAGVIAAWLEVDKTLEEVIESKNLEMRAVTKPRAYSPRRSFELLHQYNFVDADVLDVGIKALRLRNEAMHGHNQDVSFEDAVAMAQICEWLVERLKAA